jgi:cell division protein FtsW (lipid II flippase)
MIVFNGMDLIWLAIMAVLLVICGIILIIERIAYAMKKRQQKRINDAFKQEDER